MRLPPNHFLTKHYIERFNVDVRPFENINKEGYLLVYGEKVKIKGILQIRLFMEKKFVTK